MYLINLQFLKFQPSFIWILQYVFVFLFDLKIIFVSEKPYVIVIIVQY